MLDIKFIREYKDIVEAGAKKKGVKISLDELIALDDKRIAELKAIDDLRAEINKVSLEISRDQNSSNRAQTIEEMRGVKEEIKSKEEHLKQTLEDWQRLMLEVPNIPSPDTPEGPDESGNKVIRSWGEKRNFEFKPRDHAEIGKILDVIDNETATVVTGSRFTYLKGDLVLLQFAMINFLMSIFTNGETLEKIISVKGLKVSSKPFIPVIPPFMIKPNTFLKMGRLHPKEERYHIPSDDLYLIGSAEHTMGAMHMDYIFEEKDMPMRYIGYSPAFRREAGTYGKDTHGILRLHQFEKVEMETFCLPEHSLPEQELLIAIQEHFMQSLQIPYQVVLICTGDMGKPDYRQVDIEAWLPAQNSYRETHTADLMTSFQSRRLNTKVKRTDGKIELVHMNDATAAAMGRMLIAIMENYQEADGSVTIPEVLRPYMGGKEKITKNSQ